MKVERLVVDTNVWIAALISPDGTARELVRAVLDRDIDVLFTESTFNELVSRLAKPKFDPYRDAEQWHAFLTALVDRAQWVEDSGEADAIISGDRDLLGLGVYEGVPILTPAEFLVRVAGS
jgi:predicted nucleic acid-binding protein